MRLFRQPVLCNYYVTYRCNAECGFCDIWERPSPYSDPELVKKNLLSLKNLGVKVIDFTGGEPLLHNRIEVLLKIAKDLGFVTTLTTNCLLYPKKATQLKGLVDMLHFSVDFNDKESHDQSRGVPCFDFVMESIDIALSLGERPDILFTVFEDNLDHIGGVYEDIVLPNDLILILNPVFEYNQVGSGLTQESLDALSGWGKYPGIYLNQGFIALRRDGGNHIDDPVCKAASSTIVISPDNKLMLPCYHLGTWEIPIDEDLATLYQSERVQKMVSVEGRLPECEGCTINCYMQPSFAVDTSKYWWKALPSTLKYNRAKGTWKQLFH